MLIAKNNDDDFINLSVLKEDSVICEKILIEKNVIKITNLIRQLNDFDKTLKTDFKIKMSNLILNNFNIILEYKLEKISLAFIIKNLELSKDVIKNYKNIFLESFKKIAQEQIQEYNNKHIVNFNVIKVNNISEKLKTLEDIFSFLIISNNSNVLTENIKKINNFYNFKLMNNSFIKNNFKEILCFIPFNNLNLLSLFFDDDFTIINKNGEELNYKKYFIFETVSNLLWFSIASKYKEGKKFNLQNLENILNSLDENYKLDIKNFLSSQVCTENNKEIIEKCLLMLNFTTIKKTKKIAI